MSVSDSLEKIQQLRRYIMDNRDRLPKEELAALWLELAQAEANFHPSRAAMYIGYAMLCSDRYRGLHHTLARLYVRQRAYDKALEEITLALEEDFGNPVVRYNYAVILSESGSHDEAYRILQALVKDGDDKRFLYTFACVCARAGKYAQGAEIAKQEFTHDMRYLFVLYKCREYDTIAGYLAQQDYRYSQFVYLLKLYVASLLYLGKKDKALTLISQTKAEINPFLDDKKTWEELQEMTEQVKAGKFYFGFNFVLETVDDVFYKEG